MASAINAPILRVLLFLDVLDILSFVSLSWMRYEAMRWFMLNEEHLPNPVITRKEFR
jgi:hypothetical protein